MFSASYSVYISTRKGNIKKMKSDLLYKALSFDNLILKSIYKSEKALTIKVINKRSKRLFTIIYY